MVEKVSQKILDILSDESDNQEQRDILLFGITRIVEDIPKYIGLLIICLLLSVIKQFILVMFVTIVYKTFTGGVHLHTNIGCFICAIISILLCIYLPQLIIKYDSIRIPLHIIVYIFSVYAILVYVPADVPEIPIINEKRRRRDKIMSFLALNLLYIISIFIINSNLYACTIIVSILNIDIMTTRIMYKIFKNKYGYETYVPDELLMTE